ncbi:Uncharacterised protein [Mycobacteroides abscessus subsp. abscessus]|nr:Uncharacterised protein [Mycobacteroides abscessus subsp. abscessus]
MRAASAVAPTNASTDTCGNVDPADARTSLLTVMPGSLCCAASLSLRTTPAGSGLRPDVVSRRASSSATSVAVAREGSRGESGFRAASRRVDMISSWVIARVSARSANRARVAAVCSARAISAAELRSRVAAMRNPDTPSANGTMANAALHAASAIIVAGDEIPWVTLPVTLIVIAQTIRYRAAGAGFHAIIAQIVPNTTKGPSQ